MHERKLWDTLMYFAWYHYVSDSFFLFFLFCPYTPLPSLVFTDKGIETLLHFQLWFCSLTFLNFVFILSTKITINYFTNRQYSLKRALFMSLPLLLRESNFWSISTGGRTGMNTFKWSIHSFNPFSPLEIWVLALIKLAKPWYLWAMYPSG